MQRRPIESDEPKRSPILPAALRLTEALPCMGIAIVDDEALMRELLADMLGEQGHAVTCFETAQQALEAAAAHWFDVIVTDIKMPIMDGIEFYARLLELHPEQAAQLIFVSGDLLAPATRAFLDRTGCLCLSKPFRCEALLAKIEELYQRGRLPKDKLRLWELPRAA